MPRWLVVTGRVLWVIPVILAFGLLTWVPFVYAGIRMRSRLWIALGGGYLILAIFGIVTAPSDGGAPVLFVITWLTGIGLFGYLLYRWIPMRYGRQASPSRAVGLAAPPAPPVLSAPPNAPAPVMANTISQESTDPTPPMPVPAPAERPMVFISHATSDRLAVERLAVALETAGVRVWLASKDVAVGANYAQEITDALTRAAGVAVVLTSAAISSPHVRREVNLAIDRGRELLPIDLSQTPGFLAMLPGDWTYWLSLAQVLPYTDDARTAAEIVRRLGVAG